MARSSPQPMAITPSSLRAPQRLFHRLPERHLVFGGKFGQDTITNFNTGPSHDTIKIDKALVSDFDHLNLKQVGNDTLITVTSHDTSP